MDSANAAHRNGKERRDADEDQRPDDGYIVDSLGWAFYRIGNYVDAVKNLERAIDLKPEDPTINDHLGDAYWRIGRTLEAKQNLYRLIAERLHLELGMRMEDVLINLVEVKKENWSFGNGVAQYVS